MKPFTLLFTTNPSHDRKPVYSLHENTTYNDCPEKIADHTEIFKTPVSAALLYTQSPDYESFKNALIKLHGKFSFEVRDMIDLGEAYFEKYPDNFNSSTAEEIHIGYRIARISLVEQIIKDIPDERKHYYRKMYYKSDQINSIVSHIIKKFSKETIYDDYLLITTSLDILYLKICSIPTGMIKERYTGGISIFFNIAYLLRTYIKRNIEL